MFISETHLTHRSNCQIDGYCFYDTKHSERKAHGGTEIFIRSYVRLYLLEDFYKDLNSEILYWLSLGSLKLSILIGDPDWLHLLTNECTKKLFSDYSSVMQAIQLVDFPWVYKPASNTPLKTKGRVNKSLLKIKKKKYWRWLHSLLPCDHVLPIFQKIVHRIAYYSWPKYYTKQLIAVSQLLHEVRKGNRSWARSDGEWQYL